MVLSASSSQDNMFSQASSFLTSGNKILPGQAPVVTSPYYYNAAFSGHAPNQVSMTPTQNSFGPTAGLLPSASQLSPSNYTGWSNYPYNMWQHPVAAQLSSVFQQNNALDFLQQQSSAGAAQASPVVRGSDSSGYSQETSTPESFSPPSVTAPANLCLPSPDAVKTESVAPKPESLVQSTGSVAGSCLYNSKNLSDASRICQPAISTDQRVHRAGTGAYGNLSATNSFPSTSLAPPNAFPCGNGAGFSQRDPTGGLGLSTPACYFPTAGQLGFDKMAAEYSWMRSTVRPSGPGTNNIRVRTRDKYRMVYTDYQRIELEKEFYTTKYINTSRKTEISRQLGLTERQIKIWFQNRRAKERKCVRKSSSVGSPMADVSPKSSRENPAMESNNNGVVSAVKTECTSTCNNFVGDSVTTPSTSQFVFPQTPTVSGIFSSPMGISHNGFGHYATQQSLCLPDGSSYNLGALTAGGPL